MKPIYKFLELAAMTLQVSVRLQAQVTDGESSTETPIPAKVLDSLRVELIAPNVSGARDLIKSGECEIDGSNLAITLNAANWIKGATYRVQVLATFGTQTQVIYALDVIVPYYAALSDTPQEYEDEVTVVSTISDVDKSGADATVYSKDGEGNAHVTTPLSVGNGVANGTGAIASGNANNGASIQATSDGAIASGNANNGASIQAGGDGAIASGNADGEGASIQADGTGAMASGNADGEGASIQAGGDGAIASGYANNGASIQATSDGSIASGYAADDGASIQATSDGAIASGYAAGEGASIQATSDGAIASGYADATNGNVLASGQASQAFGIGVKATQDGQMVLGKCNVVDTNGDYALIVGNGTADNARSNAFAIDWDGNLVLFNAGTPVVLTPAKLATLIA